MSQNQNNHFRWPVTVYYEDTDVAGVVYHANYLKFMERARTEWLRALGLDQTLLIDQDIAFAVAHMDIDYLRPARFNYQLWATAEIERIGRASVSFVQRITDRHQPNMIYAKAWVKVACVTLSTMKPRPLPEILRKEWSVGG